MYYRRKIILAVLEQFDSRISKTRLQKLLFILTRWQEKKVYNFVPYKYGSYSFQANKDLQILKKYGIVEEEKRDAYTYWVKKEEESFFKKIKPSDKVLVTRLKKQFGAVSQSNLIKYTYVNYPYYATKSLIVDTLLTQEQISNVNKQKKEFTENQLFTIGYEGISLEKYLNKLIINDVKVLCDVRKNSLSRKYGFSKTQLKTACESMGILFLHIPQLGIKSEKRKKLLTLKDYNELFEEYEKTTLVDSQNYLNQIIELLTKYHRVALTCFEESHCMCHRGRITNKLKTTPNFTTPIKHL